MSAAHFFMIFSAFMQHADWSHIVPALQHAAGTAQASGVHTLEMHGVIVI